MALTSIAFVIVFFAGLALCIFRHPVWGLYTYLAAFYLHPPSRWWGQFLPDLRWSLLAAVVTLLCLVMHKRMAERPSFMTYGLPWIFVIYVVWMWVQAPFVVSSEHLEGAVLFTKYLILLYLIYEIVDSPERVRDFLLAHVVGCFYLAWLAYAAPPGGRLEGVGGPGINDANTMSMHLATGVIVASTLLMTERGWRFWLPVACMPFLLNGIMQGNSRGAVIGLAAGGLCLFWLKPPAYRKQFIAFGILGAVLLGYLANDAFVERMSSLRAVTTEEQEFDFSAASRLTIVEAQWAMLRDYPWGAGHAGTTVLSPNYLEREYLAVDRTNPDAVPMRSSHNTFMSVIVDQGIPGLVLLAGLLIWVWRSVGAVTRRSAFEPRVWGYGAAIGAALMVAAAAGQFAPYLKTEVQFWLLALLISMKGLSARSQQAASATTGSSSGRVWIHPDRGVYGRYRERFSSDQRDSARGASARAARRQVG